MPPPPVGQLAMRRRLRRHFGYANLGCTILVLAATHVHHHVLCYAGVKKMPHMCQLGLCHASVSCHTRLGGCCFHYEVRSQSKFVTLNSISVCHKLFRIFIP